MEKFTGMKHILSCLNGGTLRRVLSTHSVSPNSSEEELYEDDGLERNALVLADVDVTLLGPALTLGLLFHGSVTWLWGRN